MSTILFDIFPATGHYNASFLLAKQLVKENRIIYICDVQYQKIVEENGFEAYVINQNTLSILSSYQKKRGILFSLLSCFFKQNNKILKAVSRDYRQLYELYHPDLLLLDSHHFYKTVVYNNICEIIIRFQSMLSTCKSKYIPPFCCSTIPLYTRTGYIKAEYAWWKFICISYAKRICIRIVFPRNNLYYYVKTLAEYSHYPLCKHIESKRYTTQEVDLKEYKEIVLPPYSFDFPMVKNQALFCKTEMDEKRDSSLFTSRYMILIERLNYLRMQKDCFIVYCSLGTLGMNDKERVFHFFKQIRKIAIGRKYLFFVLSVGREFEPNTLLPLPENILVFKQVPQIHLLKYCDLMITHGGMNSIAECIHQQVPMLVYPLNQKWDQPGNGARVVFQGLGLRGNISTCTADSIKKQIDRIHQQYDFYKENIRKMKVQVNAEPNTAIQYINLILQ